jgi:predicted RNase H-like nuclease (RuvC/YqgF family)
MEKEDDLYGDLKHAPVAKAASLKQRAPNDAQPLQQEVEKLQHELQHLRQENLILKRNMGTLFRTARAEVDRKNTELQALHQQILELQQQQGGH